ncbi:hypothetical protein E2F49_09910 [Luteimonas terrae]|uniref:Uncharacterized protein n=1 Tax=Luteimonas terrae TaxID=1530191 RepID=A0A4R5U863_9GAMM|nr:hypothetical protein E2F49_09910 [Luteimonas terrae]
MPAKVGHGGRRPQGAVACSSASSVENAAARDVPHMSGAGRSEPQKAGRSGRPNRRQRSRSSSCTQATPAGLPSGMPGIGDVIEGAMQQAAQPSRQSTRVSPRGARSPVPATPGRRHRAVPAAPTAARMPSTSAMPASPHG